MTYLEFATDVFPEYTIATLRVLGCIAAIGILAIMASMPFFALYIFIGPWKKS